MGKKGEVSFEENIGIKWFARIGILALVLGVAFFIKYAIDNNLIDYMTRIVLGLAAGLILVIVGQLLIKSKDLFILSRTLIGGGIAIMYFSAYAAYYFEAYRKALGITIIPEIIILTAIIILGIILAIKDDSKIIAGEAFFLGFFTSLINLEFQTITLVYNLLLTLGLVVLVVYKKWAVFGILGVLATYLVYLPWQFDNANSFNISMLFLISFFVIHLIQTLFAKFENEGVNVAISLINSFAFFFLSYDQISTAYPTFRGLYLLVLGLLYFSTYLLISEKKNLSYTFLALALFFVTLAIPVQFNQHYVALSWAFETLLLTYIALKSEIYLVRVASYLVAFITAIKLIFFDTWGLGAINFANFLESTRFISFIFGIACFYACAYLYRKHKSNVPTKNTFVFVASFLSVLIIILEGKQQWETLFLELFILILVICCSFMKDSFALRMSALVSSGFLVLKLLLSDSWDLPTNDNLLLSVRALTFFSAAFVFYLCSWIRSYEEDSFSTKFYSWLGTGLFAVILAIELKGYWLSVAWAVFGLVLLIMGFVAESKILRIQGIIILCLAILKAFLYDVWEIQTVYRIISFMILGVVLLLTSLLYSKFKDNIKEMVTK